MNDRPIMTKHLELFVNGRDLSDSVIRSTLYSDHVLLTFTLDGRFRPTEEHLRFLKARDSSGVTVICRMNGVGCASPYRGSVGILKMPQMDLPQPQIVDECGVLAPAEIECRLVLYMQARQFGELTDVQEIDKTLRQLALLECPLANMFSEP